tara:strand:- start:427 stop:672 length:246 start_codon:yes stop_codon:yes gene_type:complete
MKYIIKLNNKIVSKRNTCRVYNFCSLVEYKCQDGTKFIRTQCNKNNLNIFYSDTNTNITYKDTKQFPEAVDGVRTLEFNYS